jgi:hypothetical protein
MKKSLLILALACSASTGLLCAQDNNPPTDGARPPGREGGPGSDRVGPGGAGPRGGFHLLPPRALEQLNLTADQQKQVTELETELKAKLEKILTAEQLQQLKQMRGPRPGGRDGGPGEQGGARLRGQGRPEDAGGPPPVGAEGQAGRPTRQRPTSE